MKIVDQKVELIDSMGSDLSVVNAARVSFHKESDWERTEEWQPDEHYDVGTIKTVIHRIKGLNEKDQKLIAYLAKHGHWTPFGHAFLSFRIKAPIFVARQLVKHQVGLVWNEVSRRYVDDEPEFWFPKVWRKRAENVKQGSSDEAVPTVRLQEQITGEFWDSPTDNIVQQAVESTLWLYNSLLKNGVAPEQARIVLPQNTMTEWIWSGSIAAFARVCKLRLDPHAQAETREVAQMINDQVPKDFEHSWRALLGDATGAYPKEDATGKALLA